MTSLFEHARACQVPGHTLPKAVVGRPDEAGMTVKSASLAKRQRAEVATWHRRNPLNVVRIIRTIRSHETASQQLPA